MRTFGTRAEVAKQLFAAAFGVLAGENPLRRLRKALTLLSVPAPPVPGVDKDVRDAGFRVVRFPPLLQTQGPVCLLVALAPDGRFFPHTLRFCADLRRSGLKLVLIAVTDRPDLACLDPGPDVADAVVVRENHGYDFSAWASTLRHLPEIWSAPEIWFVNDSVYHSTAPLAAAVEQVRTHQADVVGMTGSGEIAPHFQSYFFVLKAAALRNPGVRRFWDEVRSLGDKDQVIRDYEVGQKAALDTAGLSIGILFPASGAGGDNQLHHGWRTLLGAGFPFVKVQLLRDNPYGADLSGWRGEMAGKGFEMPEIAFHLGARPNGAAALLELR